MTKTDAEEALRIFGWALSRRGPGGYPRFKLRDDGNVAVMNKDRDEGEVSPATVVEWMREEWWEREHAKWTRAKVVDEFCDDARDDDAIIDALIQEVVRLRNAPALDVQAAAREIAEYASQNLARVDEDDVEEIAAILARHTGGGE